MSGLTAEDLGTVHFIGIGGVGMSGLARLKAGAGRCAGMRAEGFGKGARPGGF